MGPRNGDAGVVRNAYTSDRREGPENRMANDAAPDGRSATLVIGATSRIQVGRAIRTAYQHSGPGRRR